MSPPWAPWGCRSGRRCPRSHLLTGALRQGEPARPCRERSRAEGAPDTTPPQAHRRSQDLT
eukprot:2396324-Alexandrium_andersonii.AAC.1